MTQKEVKKEPVVTKPQEAVVTEKLKVDKSETPDPGNDPEVDKGPKVKVNIEGWNVKTALGRDVRAGIVTDIDLVLDQGIPILETEIIDTLLPNIESELLMIGQAKGKFGGGQRRIFKQTQRKTREGNKPSFATFAVVGDKNGHVGIGYGKSKETVPAREKAIRGAKISVFKIARGCGSWECGCKEPHSIPYEVHGKCGSVKITLIPAPRGKGLVIEKECMKICELAGIEDVWAKAQGQTKVKSNLIKACVQALQSLTTTKSTPNTKEVTGYIEGGMK